MGGGLMNIPLIITLLLRHVACHICKIYHVWSCQVLLFNSCPRQQSVIRTMLEKLNSSLGEEWSKPQYPLIIIREEALRLWKLLVWVNELSTAQVVTARAYPACETPILDLRTKAYLRTWGHGGISLKQLMPRWVRELPFLLS